MVNKSLKYILVEVLSENDIRPRPFDVTNRGIIMKGQKVHKKLIVFRTQLVLNQNDVI